MNQHDGLARIAVPLLGILLVAINLRPVITAVGPVLPALGEDLSLGPSALGLLGALPIAMFGLVSAMVQNLIARFGVERTTAGALALLTVATVLRSWPGPHANLWIGTVLVGAAIAIGNVAVPVLVKQSFPRATALVTSIYVAVLGIFAGLAAALAVPLAAASTAGWRLSLGVWAVLTCLGLVFWVMHALRSAPPRDRASMSTSERRSPHRPSGLNVWRTPMAWQISAYMGLQSGVFYISLTWLPTVEQALGISATAAGWHMFLLQIAGIVGNLLVPVLMRVGGDQRMVACLPGSLFLAAMMGILLAPTLVVLWVIVLGLGTGASFVVALSLIAMRANDLTTASRLSSMAQAIGYAIAALGLFLAGLVQGWNTLAVLGIIAIIAVGVIASGMLAGREQALGEKPSPALAASD